MVYVLFRLLYMAVKSFCLIKAYLFCWLRRKIRYHVRRHPLIILPPFILMFAGQLPSCWKLKQYEKGRYDIITYYWDVKLDTCVEMRVNPFYTIFGGHGFTFL